MTLIRICLAAGAVSLCASGAAAQLAQFDGETEGFKGESFTSGGITFFDINTVSGFYPDGLPFVPEDNGKLAIVEDSTYAALDFPDYISSPNALTFGLAFIGGPNLTIGPLATARMQPEAGGQISSVEFDMVYYENGPWGGILVTLEAISAGTVVATDSFVVSGVDPGRDNPTARHMAVSFAGGFDSVRIYSWLNGDYTTIRGLVDNVEMTPVSASCYANCDGSTATPVLNVADFSCFLGKFAAGEPYANCDGSTAMPVLNVADFSCFLGKFAAGCR